MKAKTRKARKRHHCDDCHGKIFKGETYSYKNLVFVEDDNKMYSYEKKTCTRCKSPKASYKREQHRIRAEARRNNCPDADFQPVWQGGWHGEVADGGDVKDECHKCNLHCGTNYHEKVPVIGIKK